MGSTQPSETDMPFGYMLQPFDEVCPPDPPETPPEPPPGHQILSDNEQKALTNLLDGLTSQGYATMLGEGLNFTEEWHHVAPQLVGTATSFGQQPSDSMASPGSAYLPQGDGYPVYLPAFPPDMLSSPSNEGHHPLLVREPSADVTAATALLQNGPVARPRSSGRSHEVHTRGFGPPPVGTMGPMGPSVGHLRHQPISDFREHGRRMSQTQLPADTRTTSFAGAMLEQPGTQLGAAISPSMDNPSMDLQWGSDANFGKHFIPQSEKETSEALEKNRREYVQWCFETSSSAGNTRPPSPLHVDELLPLMPKARLPVPAKAGEDFDMPPPKRRKSKAKSGSQEVALDEDPTPSPKTTRGRKPGAASPGESPQAAREPLGRRRKSGTNGTAKPPKENLTEEQKRENHIRSEQKRRTLIKEGFEDLSDIVPGLRSGGLSKSTMLSLAADWLQDLLLGNGKLEAQLAELQGR